MNPRAEGEREEHRYAAGAQYASLVLSKGVFRIMGSKISENTCNHYHEVVRYRHRNIKDMNAGRVFATKAKASKGAGAKFSGLR